MRIPFSFIRGPKSAPVLTSFDHDLADTAGGDLITTTGANLADATACTVGGVRAVMIAATSTSLVFEMPSFAAPRFGVGRYLLLSGAANYISTSAYAGWAVVWVDSASSNTANSANNDTIIGTTLSGRWGVYVRSNQTVSVFNFTGAAEPHVPAVPLQFGAWNHIQWDFDGTTLKLRVNRGPWSTVPSGPIDTLSSYNLAIGRQAGQSKFLDGRVRELAIRNASLPDATHDDVAAYVSREYGLTFPGITPSAFDPTTISLQGYWRRRYIPGRWPGVASAGESVERAATNATPANAPTVSGAGTYDVLVTTPAGTSNALVIEAFGWESPTSATLRNLWMPYMGGLTTETGGKVSRVPDQVGNMHQVQATDSLRPTLVESDGAYGGRATLHYAVSAFDAENQQSPKIEAPVSLLTIGHLTSQTTSLGATTESLAYNMVWRTGTEVEFFGKTGGTRTTTSQGEIGSPGAVLVTRDTSGANPTSIYTNDLVTPKGSGTAVWTPCGDYCIGLGGAGVAKAVGTIAGTALYSGILSASDRAKLAKLIRLKFGLSVVTG